MVNICPILTVIDQKPYSDKNMVTRISVPSGMRVWFMPTGLTTRAMEVLSEVGKNIEWVVEEGDNVFNL